MQLIYVLAFIVLHVFEQHFLVAALRCRCLSTNSSCWPNTTRWQAFSQSVDGRILYPIPSAAVCNAYQYDANACAVVKAQWSDSIWRADQAGAMQNHNWEKSSCSIMINSTTCNQGAVPVIAVNATLPEHVQATVRFAAANNLRLVTKTTGHDYLGRSGAASSLLLWLHYMKNMTLIEKYSSCGGMNLSNVARISAGVQWGEVYKWLNDYNLTAIGGASSTVGAVGGYLQGGGHGPLSPWQGLAVDQVLEYDVVLANGDRQTVSPCQNGDLFWALSGGGGGTYAIVLSAVIKTFPSPYMIAASYSVTAPNETRYTKLVQSFVELLPSLSDAGWSSYFFMDDLKLYGIFQVPNGDFEAFSSILNQFAANNSDLNFNNTSIFATGSFYDFFKAALEMGNPTGFNVLLGSRLIPSYVIRNQPDKVAQAFVQAKGQTSTGSGLLGHLVAGGKVSNTPNNNISVNPAWRTSLLHMVCTQGWLDTTSDTVQAYLTQQLSNRVQILNTLSADSQGSCYLNEADPNELNWQAKFFGSKSIYDQLKSIKNKYDPDGLFTCNRCVGSDDWTADLNCPKPSGSVKFYLSMVLVILEIITIFYGI